MKIDIYTNGIAGPIFLYGTFEHAEKDSPSTSEVASGKEATEEASDKETTEVSSEKEAAKVVLGKETTQEESRGEKLLRLVKERLEKESLPSNSLDAAAQTPGFALAIYTVDDWCGQLSPWESMEAGEEFTGGGQKTLGLLEEEYLPYIKEELSRKGFAHDGNTILTGYSLAGLFSLWGYLEDLKASFASLEKRKFSGVISCSGSLWYPGFMDYLDDFAGGYDYKLCKRTSAERNMSAKHIYLSLGGKEEKSANPMMARVGICTRDTVKALSEQGFFVKYEVNPGGHFADSEKRLAKGICYFLTKGMLGEQ